MPSASNSETSRGASNVIVDIATFKLGILFNSTAARQPLEDIWLRSLKNEWRNFGVHEHSMLAMVKRFDLRPAKSQVCLD